LGVLAQNTQPQNPQSPIPKNSIYFIFCIFYKKFKTKKDKIKY